MTKKFLTRYLVKREARKIDIIPKRTQEAMEQVLKTFFRGKFFISSVDSLSFFTSSSDDFNYRVQLCLHLRTKFTNLVRQNLLSIPNSTRQYRHTTYYKHRGGERGIRTLGSPFERSPS